MLYWKFGVRNDDRLEWKTFDGAEEPRPFIGSMKRARDPALPSDGHLVASESDDSGATEAWIARFPDGEEKIQL